MSDHPLVPSVPPFELAADELIEVPVTHAAAAHLSAWDNDQKLRALHEAGHAVCATVLGERVKSVDLTDRYFAHTEISACDDDQSEVETASRQLASIVIALAGRATETLVLGEPTTSVRADLRDATTKAIARFDAGLDPDAPFVALSAIEDHLVPERLREALAESVLHTLAEANERATRLVAEHQGAIVAFARSLYAARRLAGEPLEAALREAGLDPRR